MTRETKRTLTPRLRFPEFRGGPGWDSLNGNELFAPIDRRPAARGLPILAITQEHGAIPRDLIDYHVSVTDASIASYKEVRPADFIISLRSFQGGIEYSNFHGICSPAYIILNRKGDGEDHFFRHLFKSDRFIQQLTRNIEGLRDGKMISYKQFSEQLLPSPSFGEQRKIAACLGSLDDWIGAEGRKLEALRSHKKGLMQQLFPRPGESRPRLRFPEFRDAGEWEEAKLDELFHLQDGFSFKSTDLVKVKEDATQVVRITDINNMNANDDKVYVPNAFIESNDLSRYSVDNGELLLSLTGAAGFNFFIWDGGHAVTNQRTAKVTAKKGSNSGLLRLLEPLVHEKINSRGEGQNNNLSKEFLSGVMLFVPGPAEQRRIAACLSSLDDLLAAQARKVAGLKAHKKGLMQQLFPSAG